MSNVCNGIKGTNCLCVSSPARPPSETYHDAPETRQHVRSDAGSNTTNLDEVQAVQRPTTGTSSPCARTRLPPDCNFTARDRAAVSPLRRTLRVTRKLAHAKSRVDHRTDLEETRIHEQESTKPKCVAFSGTLITDPELLLESLRSGPWDIPNGMALPGTQPAMDSLSNPRRTNGEREGTQIAP